MLGLFQVLSSLLRCLFIPGEDYQELTQREERDLEYMISQTENAISNIEAFTEQLSRDLSILDGVSYQITPLLQICISGSIWSRNLTLGLLEIRDSHWSSHVM